MRLLLFVFVLMISSQISAQVPMKGKPMRFQTNLVGPPSFLLSNSSSKTWRATVGVNHRISNQPWLSLTHTLEFLNYQETFESWWFFQHPFSPYNPWFGAGDLNHKQLSYCLGLRFETGSDDSKLYLFGEPEIVFGYRWGRKMAHLLDGGRDIDVNETSISPRIKAGICFRLTRTFSLDLASELLSQKFMGVGSSKWVILPILNLNIAIK